MRVLITGSSGFIGSALTARLTLLGHETFGLDEAPQVRRPSFGETQTVSLLDRTQLGAVIQNSNPEFVFHLAARTDLAGQTVGDYESNTEGTKNLVDELTNAGCTAPVVFASSRLVFAIDHSPADLFDYRPTTAYGASKVQMEQYIRTSVSDRIPWSIVRPTSIWGPGFGVPYRNFFESVRKGHYFHPEGRKLLKSYGYIENIVQRLVELMSMPISRFDRSVYWLTDHQPLDVSEWSNLIAHAFNVQPPRALPVPVLKSVALVGDLVQTLGVRPPLTSFRLNNLITPMVYDTSLERDTFGPDTVALDVAVERTVQSILAEK